MLKAIQITELNKTKLAEQYNLGDEDIVDPLVGYYVVTNFGESTVVLGLVDKVYLDATFVTTTQKLENDYIGLVTL